MRVVEKERDKSVEIVKEGTVENIVIYGKETVVRRLDEGRKTRVVRTFVVCFENGLKKEKSHRG